MVGITHKKVNSVPAWTQADLNAQISAGNVPPGTTLSGFVVSTDWNSDHSSGNATSGFVLTADGTGGTVFAAGSGGTVTSVSVATANGISGTVANATTTPAISLTLGSITPASVASVGAISASAATFTSLNSGGIVKSSVGGGVVSNAIAGTDYQAPITLTTTGTSGASTFTSNTLNIPQYQPVLTNPVTGTGVVGQTAFWTSTSAIGGSTNWTFQNSATTPTTLATNTNVALSVNTGSDNSGTDAINIYSVYDAYLPNSAITNSLTGLNTDGATPGVSTSSSRGTGASPVQLQTGDMVGGYFGWGAQGASSPTYQNLGGIAVTTTGSSTNNLGGQINFYTKADGGTLALAGVITNGGALTNWNAGISGGTGGTQGSYSLSPGGGLLITSGTGVGAAGITLTAGNGASGGIWGTSGGNHRYQISGGNIASATTTGWSFGSTGGTSMHAATHTITLNATTGTGLVNYNTADETTNYERVLQSWVSNVYTFASQAGGTGTVRNFNFTGGNIGAGTASPSALIHGLATTEQFRLGYDVNNYAQFVVSSIGSFSLTLNGTNSGFTLTSAGTGVNTFNSGQNGTAVPGNVFNNTSTNATPGVASFLAPNMPTGTVGTGAFFSVGVANSTNNAAACQFTYIGAGSASNFFALGIYGTQGVFNIYKNGINIGNGSTVPTALLHLAAGTATAGTAPLKFTSGTNLTTTAAGAIEFNGTHLYFTATNGGTRYQLDQQSGALGAASATSLTFTSTSGIIGTTTNDDAAAGSVGEYITSVIAVGSAVSLTSNTAANVTSISLTAGDWDVWGAVVTNPGGTTIQNYTGAAISTSSATFPGNPNAINVLPVVLSTGIGANLPTGTMQIKVPNATTTTVYVVAFSTFSVSTNAAYGFISARRRR